MRKTEANIRGSYKDYKKEVEKPLDMKSYVDLCNNFNMHLMGMVFEGDEILLPYRLGSLEILGKKQVIKFDEDGKPNLAPDWPKTIDLWNRCHDCKIKKQIIYHTNEHSSGVRYKLVWSKKRVIVKNKSLYSFRLTRANKRDISKKVISGKEYYVKDK